jgi:two-component system, NarL family, sensor histidine kinase EvgS
MSGRVLIIDDEPAVRSALERSLRYFGYEVVSASGGDSAYEILQHDSFDAVMLDIHMPLMSGDALFLAIVRRWPQLRGRVILMSGDPENAMAKWSEELRCCPFLAKPFTLENLRQLVHDVIVPRPEARPRMGNGA